jgi:hypothetical protein
MNLIIPRKYIHEIKYLTTCTFIDDLVNKWGSKIVFQAIFFQVTKLHTYADRTLLLFDKNKVRYPFHKFHRIDETNFDDFLYLSLYRPCLARIDGEKLVPDRLNIRVSCDIMFKDMWINSLHLLIRLGKYVVELFKEFSVDLNLFGGKIDSDKGIFHDHMGSRDFNRNCFSYTFHVSLNIYFVCS